MFLHSVSFPGKFALSLSFIYLSLRLFCLKDNETGWTPLCWFTPQMFTTARAVPGSRNSILGLLCGWQGPNYVSHHLLINLPEGTLVGDYSKKYSRDLNLGILMEDAGFSLHYFPKPSCNQCTEEVELEGGRRRRH